MLDEVSTLRYLRQLKLKEIGSSGQEKLFHSKVLVVGTGGLGSPVLYYLVAAGIGTIGIADFDSVELSNLQRQIIHFSDDLGKPKVDSAEAKLKRLNPAVRIIKHPYRIGIDNLENVLQEYDVVVDAVDNFPARFLISDGCYFAKKPLVEGAVLGFEGILMTIIPGDSPCYRCLYPEPPDEHVVPTSNERGILGAVAGIIGSLQALEVMKVILGIGETLSGRLLRFDGLTLSFREVEWHRKSNCPLCGPNPKIRKLSDMK